MGELSFVFTTIVLKLNGGHSEVHFINFRTFSMTKMLNLKVVNNMTFIRNAFVISFPQKGVYLPG